MFSLGQLIKHFVWVLRHRARKSKVGEEDAGSEGAPKIHRASCFKIAEDRSLQIDLEIERFRSLTIDLVERERDETSDGIVEGGAYQRGTAARATETAGT